jgi:hypothetical protein
MLCRVCTVMDVMWGLYGDGCYVGFVRSWMLCGVCTVMDDMWGLYGHGCYVGFVR